ncbi:MAG: homocysteine S-methyltransferase [Nocardioidaceae bacterium]
MPPPLAEALDGRAVVLDGGLATRLEERGHDLSDDLWSARLLLDRPDEVVAAHRDYFAAGAQVATTASYQLSYEGAAQRGLDHEQTDRLLRGSIALAREAADSFDDERPRWVAASVGPYGAMLADGSEYTGDYGLSVAQLRAWHRPRLAALAAAGADVLALETVPCLAEAEALLTELAGTGLPCWLSLTADEDGTRLGEPIGEAFAMARDVREVVAVGVNCCDATVARALVGVAARHSGKPVVVYPNSGEGWDGASRTWVGEPDFSATAAVGWVHDGARLVGGCCRVGPDQIGAIAAALTA